MNATSRLDRLLVVPEQRLALAALEGLVADPASMPSLVFLHGPAGGGKTRLAQWLVEQLDGNIAVVAAADAPTSSGEEPEWLIVEDLQYLPLSAVEAFLQRLDQRRAHDLATVITATAGPRHLRFRGRP